MVRELEKATTSNSYIGSYYPIDEEPEVIHILTSGHCSPRLYLVIYEDAFESLEIYKMTAEEIQEKYKINVETGNVQR